MSDHRIVVASVLAVMMASSAWAAYNPKDTPDPFYPLLTPEGVRREPRKLQEQEERSDFGGMLTLEGILYDAGGGSVAIINGEVLKVGDLRDGVEVVQIDPTRVMVLKNGAEIEMKLPIPDTDEEIS